jgi:DNA-binding HxlR family transcriptional regulator
MAIKIYHEAPKSIFKEIQQVTDGDYALVHLFEEDKEYFNQFKEAIKNGREVILDNSIFELEEAFDADRFAYWVNELKPTWYIIPDALEDSKKTMSQMADWNREYTNIPGKKIGVVQGKTYKQIVACYEYMDKLADVDMIAISFDYSYYTESIVHPNKYVSWMLGRVKLLGDLVRDGIINEDKPHHLLGCGLPQEFSFYKNSNYDWIYSLDTSNPVVAGIKGISYGSDGLWDKERQKLHELINYDVVDTNMILNNIQKFRWFANGVKKV